MKRTGTLLLLCALCAALVLAGCGGEVEPAQTDYTALEIAGLLMDSQTELPDMQILALGEDGFSIFLETYYGIDESLLADGVICYAAGADATEFGVFLLKDSSGRGAIEQSILDYIEVRIGDFFGYMPDQVALLEQALVESRGDWTVLLACADPSAAREAFAACFQGQGARTLSIGGSLAPAGASRGSDAYPSVDPANVLAAWRTGDVAVLNHKEIRLLDACAEAIDRLTDEGMSEYEKELAIHDWIIQWAAYDEESKDRTPNARPHPDNDNPYGLVMGRRAICTGYSSTFQLFMDMLDIECVTVYGTARRGTSEHAWNMVNLDGDWYCVDVTWNDPLGMGEYDPIVQHQYFNVSSEFLRDTDHQWDESGVPEATAPVYTWAPSDSR